MSTYTPISTQTLSSAAASVTFSGIPQTYTDLIIVIGNALTTVNGYAYTFGVNGDTNSSYSGTILAGNGSAVTSARYSNISHTQTYFGGYYSGFSTTDVATLIVNFQNYSNTTTNKTVIARSSAASKHVETSVWLWRSTSAINQITIYSQSGANIASGTTFTLYGIGAGSPKAFGGDEVKTDGTYWYHTYRSSGIFAPMIALTCDYLVVAGGGAGGGDRGGGGGAGGYRTLSAQSFLTGTNYSVVVGAGGTGNITSAGSKGSNSSFNNTISSGGGGGAVSSTTSNANGGSGGGGWGASASDATNTGGTGNIGSFSPVEGYAGGDGEDAGARRAGGGGGSSGVGISGTSGGNGGPGTTNAISGSSVTYAGGGGGGGLSAFGTGSAGGGNGVTSGSGGNATSNTGSGGGGGGDAGAGRTGGNGGSGIVIVRYAV